MQTSVNHEPVSEDATHELESIMNQCQSCQPDDCHNSVYIIKREKTRDLNLDAKTRWLEREKSRIILLQKNHYHEVSSKV